MDEHAKIVDALETLDCLARGLACDCCPDSIRAAANSLLEVIQGLNPEFKSIDPLQYVFTD